MEEGTEANRERVISDVNTKEEYMRDRTAAFRSKMKQRCTMYICPCCGVEREVGKSNFMKTPLVNSLEGLEDFALDGNEHTYSTTHLLLNEKQDCISKLQPLLRPGIVEEDRCKVSSYWLVPYLPVSIEVLLHLIKTNTYFILGVVK